MNTLSIPFQLINWENVSKTVHEGTSGVSYWQSLEWEGLRVRLVEYSEGYLADHWCSKGHIIYCLEGSFICEMADGSGFVLNKNMSFIVSDNLSSHRTRSEHGAKLLIIDGDFLKA